MELATWISTASIAVAALVGLANLFMTAFLTLTIHRFSTRSAELEILRRNSDQWQRLNLAFIQQPSLQRILDKKELGSDEEQDIHRNLIFYLLNTLYEVYQAKTAGLISAANATRLMHGQIAVLQPHAGDVAKILALQRGYEAGYVAFVTEKLEIPAS